MSTIKAAIRLSIKYKPKRITFLFRSYTTLLRETEKKTPHTPQRGTGNWYEMRMCSMSERSNSKNGHDSMIHFDFALLFSRLL
jgi:hypothetical protein